MTIYWRRRDVDGAEVARIVSGGDGWQLTGTVLVVEAGRPCCLEYRVVCDAKLRTRSAHITGWIGDEPVDRHVDVDASGQWTQNGVAQPDVTGCVDIDLGFTPSTSLLSLRRLSLNVGHMADVRTAHLRLPELELEPLDQIYRRDSEHRYHRERDDGAVAEIDVDRSGVLRRYADTWIAVAAVGTLD